MRHYTQLIALAAATLILSGCNVMKGKETTGQYVDDATLLTRAKAALIKDSTVSATDFNIDVYKGNVTLSGVAKNPGEIERAIDDIKTVAGVRSVKSAARVATSGGDERSQ
ncbi:MAG TPA: BON domain-containing protein [Steroidobacteraceae bacterium]|jgi:hyperosmotically inducible protein